MDELNQSLERIIPFEIDKENVQENNALKLHYERYEFASRFVKPGNVLDIACGVGYGSFLIANAHDGSINNLIGVDIAEDAIAYANQNYSHPKVSYLRSDISAFFPQMKFDTIISLETIEHLEDPKFFVEQLCNWLNPNGVLIISAPVTLSTDGNPFHKHDFTKSSFQKLFRNSGLSPKDSFEQIQPYGLDVVVENGHKRKRALRKNLMLFYLLHPLIAIKRAITLMKYGMKNVYLTIVFQKVA